MAYDDLYPEGTSTATVDVTMQRNENRPRWQHETPIRVIIKETEPVGYVVTDKPRATDQDGVTTFYKLCQFRKLYWEKHYVVM